jgi:hypothetical protein
LSDILVNKKALFENSDLTTLDQTDCPDEPLAKSAMGASNHDDAFIVGPQPVAVAKPPLSFISRSGRHANFLERVFQNKRRTGSPSLHRRSVVLAVASRTEHSEPQDWPADRTASWSIQEYVVALDL